MLVTKCPILIGSVPVPDTLIIGPDPDQEPVRSEILYGLSHEQIHSLFCDAPEWPLRIGKLLQQLLQAHKAEDTQVMRELLRGELCKVHHPLVLEAQIILAQEG